MTSYGHNAPHCLESIHSMKHKSAKPVDRRVQRTRDLLRNALIAQLQERGWDVISVQHICDHANVGRSTFYTHFNSKDALLAGGFDDLRKMIRAQLLMHVNEEKPFALLRGLIALHAELLAQDFERRFDRVHGNRPVAHPAH